MARVALVYSGTVEGSKTLAERCAWVVERNGLEPFLLSNAAENFIDGGWRASFDLEAEASCGSGNFAVTFGGDGTILRVARWLAGTEVPIVGVQMGRLGFLAELQPNEVTERLGGYLAGDYWIDRRAMLQIRVLGAGGQSGKAGMEPVPGMALAALNDVVVGAEHPRRTVSVEMSIDAQPVHEFRCDGVIVATATGSTAYSFAAGGPVLAPDSRDVVVTPIAPHLSALRTLMVPSDVSVQLRVPSPEAAELTVDGQIDQRLKQGEAVDARIGASTTLFARRGSRAELYRRILAKLG